MEQMFDRIHAALDAGRQDREALESYWEFIQSISGNIPSSQMQAALSEAYRCLYQEWKANNQPESLAMLVDSACQRRLGDASVLTYFADEEFHAGRSENALRLYDRLLTLKTLNASGYQRLKHLCFQRQPFDEFSNLLLQRCLEIAPDDLNIQHFLFSQYLLDDKYTYSPYAPTIYHAILRREPDNLGARAALCECYARQKKYDQAIAEGEAGLQVARNYPDILETLARMYYEKGEYGKVITCCAEVLAKRPGRPEMQVLLATIYAKNILTTGDAIKQYVRALRCDPKNFFIRLALFRAYLRKLLIDEAIRECETIIAACTESDSTDNRDFRAMLKEMIAEYERVIRRLPEELAVYLMTAKLYEYLGHFNKALLYYRTILEFPLDAAMIVRLIELLEKLTTFQAHNPHLYLYLGLLYHKSDRREDAKLAFRAAMYADFDERDVNDILVKYDPSIWQYPPVLVILAHHRIVTREVLEGLIQAFRQPDRDDWEGVIWVLQDLYDLDDLLMELRQIFTWEHFGEVSSHLIPLIARNGSPLAAQLLEDLLSHRYEDVRVEALQALTQLSEPFAAQYIAAAARENPYADVRRAIANYYAQQRSDTATYQLVGMLRDEERAIRLAVVNALQEREIQPELLREVLFTEQDSEVKIEVIRLFTRVRQPEYTVYLTHLLSDIVTKRYDDGSSGSGGMYTRLKKLIRPTEQTGDVNLLAALIQAVGHLRLEQNIFSLAAIANSDRSQRLRLDAIEAIGNIGSPLGLSPLQHILHTLSESQEIRNAAEQALDRLVEQEKL